MTTASQAAHASVDLQLPIGGSFGADSGGDDEFWRGLERLSAWKRRYMPVLNLPQGTDVLIWLLRRHDRVRPLKDLYRSSRFSEPTMRAVLKALADDGFISIETDRDDLRVRVVRISPKLALAVGSYLDMLRQCASCQPSVGHAD